ncbi:unnamed protein product [Sphenostylis stenocarpa]|uniref:TIR domain-containing protein n=1 Tax=Sphenostylis stenocarpa TaxID=92480 RepID=A0AA86TBN5_9FABA|nr:unnamed protein product [Sphenostylis stenocarpa]
MNNENDLFRKQKVAEEKPVVDKNAPDIKYDVFVSFRGKEIRKGFLSHLTEAFAIKKINAFVDDKLEKGEAIWSSLVAAIERSAVSLIIFSPDYASSPWCLKEVAKIIECQEKYGRTVIPVFYNIEPTHVRHQSGSYQKAFAEHATKHETELQLWRCALHKSASFSGIESTNIQLHVPVKVDGLKSLLRDNESDNSVAFELRRLEEKTLITISEDNIVSMHDSLQEMAWEIVRQESIDDPGSRSRLWDSNDICEALVNEKVGEAIRSIQIQLTPIKKQKLSPHQIFAMRRLKFLEISGMGANFTTTERRFAEGAKFMATELRFLCWENYPLRFLPESFNAEKLVILKLNLGEMVKLWDGVKNLVNLKKLDLKWSARLMELPDLSRAERLEELYLCGCYKLISVHSSIFSLPKLERLNLSNCESLTVLESNAPLLGLRYLDLQGCVELEKFSLISENMKELKIVRTKFEVLPSSFGDQLKLEWLYLEETYIERLPSFNNHTDDQLKENRNTVLFIGALKLDEYSIAAIGLNAKINIMKFANQHLSTPNHNSVINYGRYHSHSRSYRCSYVYPGSSVPEWLEYRTAEDCLMIDLSSAPPSPKLGFILCLILDMSSNFSSLQCHITVLDGEDERESDSFRMFITYGFHDNASNHECPFHGINQLSTEFWNMGVVTKLNEAEATKERGVLFEKQKVAEEKPVSDNYAPEIKYDVFVSFRGKDIRDGFLSHLTQAFYTKKINAFVDDKLEKGEEIWPSLVAAIEKSAISIIIFSPDYVFSRWCLEEVVKILECRDKYERIVIPVFYKVTPTDVRRQSGRYENAFVKHGLNYKSKVRIWKDALKTIADLSGIESSKLRNDAELVKEIADLVLKRLHEPVKVGDLKSLLKDNKSDNSVAFELKRLEDKALISISEDNIVCIDDSLQEMAWEIVRQESIDDPGSRSRLWDPNDIYEALENDKVNEAIRSIQIQLTPIDKCLAEGAKFMATELRFLCWKNYPLKSLPESFNAEKLVILKLNQDEMVKLWDGVKNLVNLKRLDLKWSMRLKELPDLSRAERLEELYLCGSYKLTSVHSSIFTLPKLERLNISVCNSLTVLESNSHLPSLRYLDLKSCTNLKKFSLISENMKELKIVNTKVEALPLSFGDQLKLESLYLEKTNIERLPLFNNLSQFLYLFISHCKKLQTIPNLPPLTNTLDVKFCSSLKTLPELSPDLKILCLESCTSLENLPELPPLLKTLNVSHCSSLQTLPNLPPSLETLYARKCKSLRTVLFPSTAVEQLRENRQIILLSDSEMLDEPSIAAIELNAKINMMKFAKQQLSAPNHNPVKKSRYYDVYTRSDRLVYMYPGSSVPEWFEYSTIKDCLIIDLSSAPPSPKLGFILCLILDMSSNFSSLQCRITIFDSEDGGKSDSVSFRMYINYRSHNIASNHVCKMIYDQPCSEFLNARAKNQTKFKIQITIEGSYADTRKNYRTLTQQLLKGFGKLCLVHSQAQSKLRKIQPALENVEEKPISDNNTPQIKYDVFVSFRGKDIRDGFLSHLTEAFDRKKIKGFVDDKLEKGEEIWPSLVAAIERSAFSLIIFSPDYASSRWCLEEAVKIIECKEKHERIVIPVFYKVAPTDVRHQSGSYKNAFVKHGLNYKSKVQIWKDALEKFSDFSGIESSKFRNDAELVKEIVDLVLKRLHVPVTVSDLKSLLKDNESDNSVTFELRRLEDKALITISEDNIISMHDSLQEMAWEIVRQESTDDPGSRSRLWDHNDVHEALENNKVNEAIRSIEIKLKSMKKLKLIPQIFAMRRLKFLKISGIEYHSYHQLILAEGAKFMATELRFLCWENYPLKSLPESFNAEKLVILKLNQGKMEKLWDGVKNVMNLKTLDLKWCTELKELPDLSRAKRLEELYLHGCSMLTIVHSSIFSLPKLERLDLSLCYSLVILVSNSPLLSLRYLDLKGCENLKKFSLKFGNMKELKSVQTRVEALPSSFGDQVKLESLYLGETEIRTVQQLKENRKLVLLPDSVRLDEHSTAATGLNAKINLMKFANEHLSAPNRNRVKTYGYSDVHSRSDRCVYMYPGSSVPEWLEYSTREDCLIIDLSSAPPSRKLGFIFCFILDMSCIRNIHCRITIFNGEDEGKIGSVRMYIDYGLLGIASNHVCMMIYDQTCSEFLSSRAKNQTKFKIQVKMEEPDPNTRLPKRVIQKYGVRQARTVKGSSTKAHTITQQVGDLKSLLKDNESDNSVAFELRRLEDKALITIFKDNIVCMHDSLQEMALEIVRQESIDDPGSRSRFMHSFSLPKLERLDLSFCYSLTLLASNSPLLSIGYLNLEGCKNLMKFSLKLGNNKELNLLKVKGLPSSFGDQLKLESLYIGQADIERKLVLFSDSVMLDRHSIAAFGLNAKINMMKFANQHLSAPNHNAFKNYAYYDAFTRSDRWVYVYPGRSVPECFEYSTGKDCIIIDLSSAPPSPKLGFIFCFIFYMRPSIRNLQCRITIFDGEDEGKSDSFIMHINYGFLGIARDHIQLQTQIKKIQSELLPINTISNLSHLFRKQKVEVEKPVSDKNAPDIKYDVFVSFRGKEIRKGFLSHLSEAFAMKKINAFVDDKLEKGEAIWPSLVAAIERSAVSLIIFSPDYASSPWCLREVVKIIECQEKYGRTVIPVFYNIEPTHVKHQSGCYQKAFGEHATKDETELQLWRLHVPVEVGDLKSLLKDNESDNSVAFELRRLEEKALITISRDNIVCMHDSLQEMAWEIVRQESIDDPGSRSRLWDPNDIYEALVNEKVGDAIRSIQIKLALIKKKKLNPQIFDRRQLKFLEISGNGHDCFHRLILAEGVKFMATELRFLSWTYCQSLPECFNAEKLVILKLNIGGMEKLWDGVKNLVNLKQLDLKWCSELKELPDLSSAKRLEKLDLCGCSSLNSVHSSIFSLPKLERLNLAFCYSLTVLASNSTLLSLHYLNLEDCHNLKKFSVISENMKELNLVRTKVGALPSSFGDQLKLESLYLSESDIERLPSLYNLAEEQNRRIVMLPNSVMLDEHSTAAIGLNAEINMMKFANQHLSEPNHNPVKKNMDPYTRSDRCVYVYPGNSVPEWLEYSTRNDCITVDLSSTPPSLKLGFIFSFILDLCSNNSILQCCTTIFDDEDGGNVTLSPSVVCCKFKGKGMQLLSAVCVVAGATLP